MSEEIFEGHRFGVSLLRRLLVRPTSEDRDRFATDCLRYARAYLQRNAYRWASGFDLDFPLALYGAANLAVANLLREEGAPPRLLRLEKEMAKLCRRKPPVPGAEIGDPPDWESSLREMGDEYLLLQLRHLLRLESGRAMIDEWRKAHPEKGKLWDQFKAHVKRMEGLRIDKDGRGWFVCGENSDLRRPPMSREKVWDILGAGYGTVRRGLEILKGELSRSNGHGGYCVLSDLVLVYIDLVNSKLVFGGNGTGAVPPGMGVPRSESGLPLSVWIESVRTDVRAMADEYLLHDARKKAVRFGNGARRAFGEVVVEVVCRKFDLGLPAYGGLSQKDLVLLVVPGVDEEEYEKGVRERIDYTVRRVRNDLAKKVASGTGGGGA